jgi:hypothetical protein
MSNNHCTVPPPTDSILCIDSIGGYITKVEDNTLTVRVDYVYIITRLLKQCEKVPHDVIRELLRMDKEQGNIAPHALYEHLEFYGYKE